MKQSYGEGLAIHAGPGSYVAARKDGAEALIGVRAGRVSSRETELLRDADAVGESGRPYQTHRYREICLSPARSQTPSTCGNTANENREILRLSEADGALGRIGKSKDVRR